MCINSITKGSTLGLMKVPKNYTLAIINSITQNSSSNERDELLKSNINIDIDMSSNLYLSLSLFTKIELYNIIIYNKLCLIFVDIEFGKHLQENILKAHKLHLIDVYSRYNLSTKYAETPFKVIIYKLIKMHFIILCTYYYIYALRLQIYEYKNLNLTENTASEIISW